MTTKRLGRFGEELDILKYFQGRKVLVTGHTGFKGGWLCMILNHLGAEVTGFSLPAPTNPSIFELADVAGHVRSVIGDIRDFDSLQRCFEEAKPEVVFHLAAQPIVRRGYREPRLTFDTNIMGTVNVLDCAVNSSSVRSLVNVTTDKVYENKEWGWGYREIDPLNGYDPYSNSKSCSELVTRCYRDAFAVERGIAVSTLRAGNVIGGGDFAQDRIIPDCIRSAIAKKPITVRNPYSTRPYQHVLEPLFAYLLVAASQASDIKKAGSYNIGPPDADCYRTGDLVDLFCGIWGEGLSWINASEDGPHEARFLKLDSSLIAETFGWKQTWSVVQGVEKTVEWTKEWQSHSSMAQCMMRQIDAFAKEQVYL